MKINRFGQVDGLPAGALATNYAFIKALLVK